MQLEQNGGDLMEIKKTKKGWEYDGIVFTDEQSALLTKEATENGQATKSATPIAKDFKLVYDGERGRSFGKFIEKVLKSQNKSIVQLASELNVSRQTLFAWMNSDSVPTRKNLETIIAITQCRMDDIKLALQDNFERQKVELFEGLQEVKRA